MDLTTLNAIGPIDGRYRSQVERLAAYFSEYALIRYRLLVEVEYFIALCESGIEQLSGVNPSVYSELRKIYTDFSEDGAAEIKAFEKVTNHDVKAVEYFLKKKMDELGLGNFKEFVHFGLTSQDINNTAIPISLRDAVHEEYLKNLSTVVDVLSKYSEAWSKIPMLARTHGQPASPTRLGKEIFVFVARLEGQLEQLRAIKLTVKFGGATGNLNAHHVAFPSVDWVAFSDKLVTEKFGLTRTKFTTQIEPYDHLASMFDAFKRINNILIDLCRDLWTYISMDYFRQKIKEGEVGSSAMPHKVNPIDFENAEGNLGIANAIYEHLSAKLPISRLQRDLTDSTVLRNLGVPFGHSMIALNAILKGLGKLELNEARIHADLENNWAVVAEGIQTILRREGYPAPYEALKQFTRGRHEITKEVIHAFIESLNTTDAIKAELKEITPFNYTGIDLLNQ